MSQRRVIVHAGFHKTGTTSAQRYLLANGKHIWPRCALVMMAQLREGAARMAVRYSRFDTRLHLQSFESELHKALSAIELNDRNVLISDENMAGRMPGRDGQMGYNATPELMKHAQNAIFDVFGQHTEIVYHFNTRAADDWLLSTYKHNLRTSRLTLDLETYMSTFRSAADLDAVARAVAREVQGTVQTRDLADLTGPAGPAQPLIDLMNLPDHLLANHKPYPAQNKGPKDDLIGDLLALNSSALSDIDLMAAKTALIGKAEHDGG